MKRQQDGKADTVGKCPSGRRQGGFVLLLIFLLGIAVFPLNEAQARGKGHYDRAEPNQYVLHFGDAELSGGAGSSSVLFLKKELLRQYPGLQVSNLRLQAVTLVAKSRFGRGVVQLRVGPDLTRPQRVVGRPGDFHNRSRHTYDRVRLVNPYRQSWGPWQMHLRGNFKVRKVVLFVEEKGGRRYGHHRPRGNMLFPLFFPGLPR